MNQLSLSLLITVIGMGLVFLALILLALMMQGLVAITSRTEEAPPVEMAGQAANSIAPDMRLHTVAAIAAALALAEDSAPAFSHGAPRSGISPWQSVQRTANIHRQGKSR